MDIKYKFPQNFWWGSATSGPQSEGRFNKKHASVFDHWFDIEPEAFFNGVGPNVASNFYNSYKEDIKLIKEIGLNSLRTSIQWTRLMKDFETGEVDEDAVRFYNAVIDESKGWMPDKYSYNYEMPGRRVNPYRGWEIYPQVMYDIAINIRDNYNNIPWYISENGMGVEGEVKYINKDGVIEDDYRIDFLKEHLEYLYKGIEEGSNCFGYHTWTLIDCWSWSNAYKNRYGFIAVDLPTQIKTIKKSGRWIKQVAENNGF